MDDKNTDKPAENNPETSDNKDGEDNNQQPTSRKDAVLKELESVASSFYTASLNTVVKGLFPEVYNNFKGVIDDYDTMKKGGTNANAQQTNQQNTK